ncbi:MAG: hypothetical protein LBJ46_09120 [Planctomycetota bacterium]|jgi:hypothetical protein|nr:hypothetical protein [Planctomycetota bacterium]
MSKVDVSDQRSGSYRTTIEFTYGECDRLPFNLLRRINAQITLIPGGGINATADFNIRDPKQSQMFVETLDLFGESGSYVHGSASDPAMLSRTSAPGDAGEVTLAINDEDDDLELEDTLGARE